MKLDYIKTLMGPQGTHGKTISPKVLNWWPSVFVNSYAMPGIKKYKHMAYTHIGNAFQGRAAWTKWYSDQKFFIGLSGI